MTRRATVGQAGPVQAGGAQAGGAQAGFTLLEVLIAITVMGMVLVLLSQGLQFGIRALGLQKRADVTGPLSAMEQTVRRVISLADPGTYPEPASLRGTSSAVVLVTELPSAGTGPLQRVDATLTVSGGDLVLRWSPRRHVTLFQPVEQWTDTVLLTGVTGAAFDYFDPTRGWLAAWSSEKLPVLIRLRLLFDARTGTRSGTNWPPIIVAPRREPIEG